MEVEGKREMKKLDSDAILALGIMVAMLAGGMLVTYCVMASEGVL